MSGTSTRPLYQVVEQATYYGPTSADARDGGGPEGGGGRAGKPPFHNVLPRPRRDDVE